MTSSNRIGRFIVAAIVAVAFCVAGCVNDRSSARGGNKPSVSTDSIVYETQVKEEAARLMRDNRGLTANDAFAAARERVAASYGSVGPTRTEREQAQSQEKFEADLTKLTK